MEKKKLTILIVDDDPNLRATMSDILNHKGLTPLQAGLGAAALAQAAEQDVDVALIDLHLEDMPGLELLQSLKKQSPGIECILLTGHATQSSAIEAINAGAYSYFQKPCDIDQLMLSIQRAAEKKTADRALRESEASLQAVLQSTADGILAVGRENKVLYANRRFAELWRIPADVMESHEDALLLQYVLDQLVDPQGFLQKVQELYQSDAESFDTIHFKDGRIFERLSRPLMQNAEVQGRVWSFHDVSERKRAEEQLRNAEQKYRSIFENATEGIHQTTSDGQILSVNPAGVRMLGFDSPEELLASHALLDTHFYVQPGRRDEFKHLLEQKGTIAGFESEVYRKDGSTAWLSENAHAVRDQAGNLLYYEGSSVDITERKRTEQALKDSEERFRSLYENATVGMYRTTPDGRILLANPVLVRLLGYKSFEQLAKRNLMKKAYETDYPRSEFIAIMERDGEVKGLESSWRRRDGKLVYVRESARAIKDQLGHILYYDGTIEDVTDRKQAEIELQASQQAEQNFAERLTILSETTTELSKTDSLDALCRRAVELARERLDFDRFSIWFIDEDHKTMRGTFGVDTAGQITDERQESFIIGPDFPNWSLFDDKVPLLVKSDAPLALNGKMVGQGMHVSAGLWDGKAVIGYVSVDNLLRQRSFTDRDCEIIRLYASALGHLISQKKVEMELQASRKNEQNFAERLTILSEVTTELSKADSLDALCRRAVELGREQLDFDRLSIFFIAEDHTTMLGTYGVDTEGHFTDEHAVQFSMGPDFPSWPVYQGKTPLLVRTNVPLALMGKEVGQGDHVSAGLWDGKAVIGYISLDNLIRQQPFSESDCELIRLYATALGHLITLKRREGELRTSEERYRMLAENMSDTVWLLDLNLKTTYISPSVTRLRGYTLDEINALPLDQQMTAESFTRLVKMYVTDLAQDRLAQKDLPINLTLELEFVKKDGDTFWSENTYSLIRDLKGQPLAILATGRDITKSKKAQTALELSERRFRALIENSTDAIVLVDPRGQILYESPAYARMMGRESGHRLGRSSFEFLHPDDQKKMVNLLHELTRVPGGNNSTLLRNRHADGSWRWLEVTATNLLTETAVQAIVVNMHDITKRKQAEEALETTERIYRQAITRTGGVPYQRDYDTEKYAFLGEGIKDLTGYPPEELTGPLFNTRIRQIESYGERVDLPHEERVQLAREGEVIKEWREDYLFERKDGSLVWLADHAVQLKDPMGAATGSLGILMDITQRKQAEENIRQRVAELEVVYQNGLNLSRLLEPKEIGREVIDTLAGKLSWRHASIHIIHPDTKRVELLVFNRPGLSTKTLDAETRRLNGLITKPGQGFIGWVIQYGESVRSGGVNKDPRFIQSFKGIQSGLYVPLRAGTQVTGVIGVESEQADAFSEADERLLKTLATQASIAIENGRLWEESRHQVEELGKLADISMAMRTANSRSEISAAILDQLMLGIFHADDACLYMVDPVSSTNIVEAARGRWKKRAGMHLKPGEGLSGLLAGEHQPYQSDNILEEERLSKNEISERPEAVVGVPLLINRQFIGSLWLGRHSHKKGQNPLPFTPSDMQLLGSVADMTANALHRASLHEQIVKNANELLIINTMGRVLAETLDLDQIYEKLDQIVRQLLDDISLVAIARFDAEKEEISCVWLKTDQDKQAVASLPTVPLEPPGQGLQSEVVHTRQPVIVGDLRAQLKKVSLVVDVGADDGRVTRSALYVPLLVHGRVIGVMQVQSCTLNRFSQPDADLLSLVANTAAVSIENARLFSETQKQLHNLAALHAIETAISASVDIHVTLNILLEQTVSELNVDAAAVLLFNPLARTLDYVASQGFRNHQVIGAHIPLGVGLVGQAALRRQIQGVSDLRNAMPSESLQKLALNIYDGEEFLAHHAIPLVAKGHIQGVLEVLHRSPFQPDDQWFTFLETLSRQAAVAIDNTNLFDNLQRSNTNIIMAYDATIQGWSQALELRDKETEGHAQRVTERTVQLARMVGVPDSELEHVRRGTLLHDIGKMGIPDAILLKPGPLTEQEWEIMRRHPVFAYEMLSSIAYLRPALDIPHYHHEKWDGSGYPDGLKGEQIPLYARIFAVVDVFDALTNDRSYRQAWPVEQAIEYIRDQSGGHFDPAIVQVFLDNFSESKVLSQPISSA